MQCQYGSGLQCTHYIQLVYTTYCNGCTLQYKSFVCIAKNPPIVIIEIHQFLTNHVGVTSVDNIIIKICFLVVLENKSAILTTSELDVFIFQPIEQVYLVLLDGTYEFILLWIWRSKSLMPLLRWYLWWKLKRLCHEIFDLRFVFSFKQS
jgi:hypothetical protein